MKTFCILLSAIAALVVGCAPSDNQSSSPTINEPAGAQRGAPEQETPRTTEEIAEQHGWVGTNDAGRSTNKGVSPGGANTRGTKQEP